MQAGKRPIIPPAIITKRYQISSKTCLRVCKRNDSANTKPEGPLWISLFKLPRFPGVVFFEEKQDKTELTLTKCAGMAGAFS
jgi:hypothetical protein